MIALELLWWAGWLYFLAWAALPLLGVLLLGPVAGLAAWALLAPWSALAGMAALHRVLPRSEAGKFRMFEDRGSVRWAIKEWAPSVYLAVFQPVLFQSAAFQRIALRAFGARLGPGALLTSRTCAREPHHLRIGRATLVGEFVHLVCSYQPRPKTLVVAGIEIGDDVLVGAHSIVAPGARIGNRCILELGVWVGVGTTIGENSRIGARTAIYNSVRIGKGVTIGKGCLLPSGSVVGDGAVLPDGTVVPDGRLEPDLRRQP